MKHITECKLKFPIRYNKYEQCMIMYDMTDVVY